MGKVLKNDGFADNRTYAATLTRTGGAVYGVEARTGGTFEVDDDHAAVILRDFAKAGVDGAPAFSDVTPKAPAKGGK